MYYCSDLDEKAVILDVKILFDKRITEIERVLIRIIIEKYEAEQISKTIKLRKTDLLKLMKYPEKYKDSDDFIHGFFSKFMKKQVNYSFYLKGEERIYKGFFPIITSVIFETDFVLVKLADEIINGYKKNTIFERIGLIPILKLEFLASTFLFLYLISNCNENEDKIYFSLEEFRNLLNIGEAYDRFYDFEKNVLIPVLDDISFKTHFKLTFLKVKSGFSKTSRIIGIEIMYRNVLLDKKKKETEYLFSLIKDRVTDYQYVKELIYVALDNYDYSKIYEIILASQKILKKNVEKHIIEQLLMLKKGIITTEEEQMPSDLMVEKYISSFMELHSEVNKALLSIGAGANHASDLVTYRKLYTVKPEEEFSVISGEYRLTVFYSLKSKSKITITKI